MHHGDVYARHYMPYCTQPRELDSCFGNLPHPAPTNGNGTLMAVVNPGIGSIQLYETQSDKLIEKFGHNFLQDLQLIRDMSQTTTPTLGFALAASTTCLAMPLYEEFF